MRERRTFSREYKLEAIKPVIDGVKSLAQVGRELDVRRNVLQRWKHEYLAQADQAFPGSGNLPPACAEQERLRREVQRLEQENDILKKTLAILCREQREGTP